METIETCHLKFLANFPYEKWAESQYLKSCFDGDLNKLMSLFFIPREKAIAEIKKSLIKKYPQQPEWVLQLVARENLDELVKVVRKYEFQLAS